jgi:hypothetical protein
MTNFCPLSYGEMCSSSNGFFFITVWMSGSGTIIALCAILSTCQKDSG